MSWKRKLHYDPLYHQLSITKRRQKKKTNKWSLTLQNWKRPWENTTSFPGSLFFPLRGTGRRETLGTRLEKTGFKAVRVAPRNFVKSYNSLPSLRKNHLNGICIDFISRYWRMWKEALSCQSYLHELQEILQMRMQRWIQRRWKEMFK